MSRRVKPAAHKQRPPTRKSAMGQAGTGTHAFKEGDISDFASMMTKMVNKELFSDIKFYIGPDQTPIFAHRCILYARCAVFKAMLEDDSVSHETNPACILPDMSPTVFLAMLEFLYTNCVTLSSNMAFDVLAAALEYGLDGLRELCVQYLVENLSVNSACDVMQSAVTYNQNDLKDKAIVFIENNTEEVLKSKGFLEISEDTLVSILRSSKLKIDEVDLCDFVKQWAETNSEASGKNVKEMGREAVTNLRLPLLSCEELKKLQEENKKDEFFPIELFSQAWELHATKCPDDTSIMSICRHGTRERDHHQHLKHEN